jgi:tetratricopeptide (TPR) repeat protein
MIALVSVLVLLRQAVVLLRARPANVEFTWLALLDVLLGGLGVVLSTLAWSDTFVLSREFHTVMISGLLGRVALSILLLGFPVAGAIGWGTARAGAGRPSRVIPRVTIGIVVGVASVLSVTTLNPEAPPPVRIWAYEFWYPPLVLWMTLCMAEAGLTILRIGSRFVRAWVVANAIALMAALALAEANGVAMDLGWQAIERVAFAAGMGSLIVPILLVRIARTSTRRRALPGRIFGMCAWLMATAAILAPLVLPAGLLIPVVFVLYGFLALPFAASLLLNSTTIDSPSATPRPLVVRLVLLACVILISASLLLPFTWQRLPPDLAPVLFIAAWIMLAETIAGGPLATLYVWIARDGVAAIHSVSVIAKHFARRTFLRVRQVFESVVSMNGLRLLILQVVLLIILIAVLLELPNRGRLVVEPFSAELLSNGGDQNNPATLKTLGQSVSDRLVSEIHALEADLEPDAELFPIAPRGRTIPRAESIRGQPAEQAAMPEGNLEVLDVKIPLVFMLSPIRPYLQRLFGVTLVNGSLQFDKEHYALLATSNTGDAWFAEVDRPLPSTPGVIDGVQVASRVGDDPPRAADETVSYVETIGRLAADIAFDIAVARPPAQHNTSAMTSSAEAFRLFRRGLVKWRQFESDKHDGEALKKATILFREATEQDPAFALAHYRLGLALRAGSDSARAAAEFRTSVKLSPTFVAGLLALASTLYDFEVYSLEPVAVSGDRAEGRSMKIARQREAEQSWQRIISLPFAGASDERAAYFGICRRSLDVAQRSPSRTKYGCGGSPATCAAYYFCLLADRLSATISTRQGDTQPENDRAIRAAITMTIGDVIRRGGEQSGESVAPPGDQARGPIEQGGSGTGSNGDVTTTRCRIPEGHGRTPEILALPFYQTAFELNPETVTIRETLWKAARAVGDDGTLRRLALEPRTHLVVADLYLARADEVAQEHAWSRVLGSGAGRKQNGAEEVCCYRRALKEYERAVQQDPYNLVAMNNYAYAFWRWRVWHPGRISGWDRPVGLRAKRYASEAVRLSEGRSTIDDRITYLDTLGEVLLALGEQRRAANVLASAEELGIRRGYYNQAYFDEVRWDAAVASLCAAEADKQEPKGFDRQRATKLLRRVRSNQALTDPPARFPDGALETGFLCRFCDELQRSARVWRRSDSAAASKPDSLPAEQCQPDWWSWGRIKSEPLHRFRSRSSP